MGHVYYLYLFYDNRKYNVNSLIVGLLDYDKNCNHDYFKRLLVGHMTKTFYERFI